MTPQEAISHESFSHARQGTGCWRDVVWIYHLDGSSPSGVSLAASGDAKDIDPILRQHRNTSPLSPGERL